ncbi:phenylalanine--tRNA ligase subunit beta [Candidatus Woesearchaeota archaeon]|nr:phenylalanine--tRNA ligase subunit beta [Candidatus Woesearchaeota archaeon]
MPTISINKKELLKELGKLSDAELKDRISMLGTDLEGIEGDEISVEIFPNRPDLLSQQGFGRALASFIGVKPGLKEYKVKKSGKQCIVDKSVAHCRPYTACAIVTDLKITEEKLKEIIMIQEKLHITFCRNRKKAAIGIYPMEHITFPIHFKGYEPSKIKFQPLEARGEMTAEQILENHPKGKDYAFLMKGLNRYACFEDAKGNILSLTPIINSHLTGKISESTKDIFIECSGFDQRILDECLAMIVTSLGDMGGTIQSMELVYPNKKLTTPNLTPKKMPMDRKYINDLLGTYLSDKEMGALLERMGFGYSKGDVLIPAYRTDILHQVDLAEDVAIAYGYENITEVIPQVATVADEDPFEEFCEKVRRLLVGHSLLEAKNYGLINHDAQTTKMRLEMDTVNVMHPVSLDYDSLRAWVTPSLIETLQRNKQYEYPQSFFEIGRVFSKGKTETGVKEQVRVSVVLCGEKADYTAIRQVLDDLLDKLNLRKDYKAAEHNSFIPGRVARVSVDGEGVAYIGEVHPEVLANFEITMPVAAFELNLTELHKKIED